MTGNTNDNYDERLIEYITQYVRNEGVPPTVDMMLENVEGKKSKSTVFNRLQKMVDAGLLVQKNKKGYYYPTSIDTKEVSIPKFLLKEACEALLQDPSTHQIAGKLYQYLKEDDVQMQKYFMNNQSPVTSDIDKILEQLNKCAENSREGWQTYDEEECLGAMLAYENAIEIVKQCMK